MRFYAHSIADRQELDWQPLDEHLLGVESLARERGDRFGFGDLAALAGRLHDLGKYAPAFQAYIRGPTTRVDHSTAGAQCAATLGSTASERCAAQLAAFCIAGHHAGLADREGPSGSLNDRLKKAKIPALDPAWRDELGAPGPASLPAGYRLSRDPAARAFQIAFLGRMIFSTLVDADYLDTEAFYAKSKQRAPDRDWPTLGAILPALIARYDAAMARPREATPLNGLRARILSEVRAKAALPKGVYTLNVPTGGGKTLASLGFALDHAKAHGMERIICAIPFTSIIDQTAKVFEDVLGDGVVLEHHSSIEEDKSEAREGRDKLRLAMENWAAPVVVTTNVQLFESLFANRTSRCRKLHALANAVIILDEAQTIPLPVLKPCVMALQELALNYGATVVLCTATQPALAAPQGDGRGFAGGFDPTPVELAPDPPALHRALRRVTLEARPEPVSDEALARELAGHPQVLVIVNSRRHALDLYRACEAGGLDGLVHLSTRQIGRDRRAILAAVRERLKDGAPCRVIATSLVEAGVDLDFPRVFRAEAGLDQITQAAGRCNREGKRDPAESIVTVFKPSDHEPPAEIKSFADAMGRVALQHDDLFSAEAIQAYFQEVYWVRGADGLDKHKVSEAFRLSRDTLEFQYRTVAERFRLIESGMEPVIVVADDEARDAIAGLQGEWLPPGQAARRLQHYVVQAPPRARRTLIDLGYVEFADKAQQFAVLRKASLYTPGLGLIWEGAGMPSIQDLMM